MLEMIMRKLTTALAALAVLALTACDRSPIAPAPVEHGKRGPGAAAIDAIDPLDDAAERLLPALAATPDARALGARLVVARGAMQAGDARAAATALDAALDAALHELARAGADAAELDAMRLNLESARARLRPRD
jgi:hypothetical protein